MSDRIAHGILKWASAGLFLAAATTGCTTDKIGQDQEELVTWHQDVAPIVAKRCASCHTLGSIAPFSVDNYDDAKALGPAMLAAIKSGRMAPWLAKDTAECKPKRGFEGDLRLTESELNHFDAWVNNGMAEGDPETATVLPDPPAVTIADPNVVAPFAAAYTVEGERDDFQCFVVDPGNTEMVWVQAAQLIPGNDLVAHHGLMFVDATGTSVNHIEENGRFQCFNPPSDLKGYLLGTWTPGSVPTTVPPSAGMPLPVGAKIVVQMHYHPTGKGPEQDLSTVQLKWTTTEPQYEALNTLIGNFNDQEGDGSGLQPGMNDSGAAAEFVIPAGATNHVETMIYRQNIPFSLPIFAIGTHMHYAGTDMKVDFFDKGLDEEECLVQTPDWDFNWQRIYNFDTPVDELPMVGPGDELRLRCTYNNSMDNPFIAKALVERGLTAPGAVNLGDETLDEMCLALVGVLAPPGTLDLLSGD